MDKQIVAILLVLGFISGCTTGEAKKIENMENTTKNLTAGIAQTDILPDYIPPADEPENKSGMDIEKLQEKVVPSGGVTLNFRWLDIGPRTVKGNALNITKFDIIMKRNGKLLTQEQMQILQNGSNEFIMINQNNSLFILDLFWAFGLVNKNPVLENSPMTENIDFIPRFASTGGWPVGNVGGGELFNSAALLALDDRQQRIVENVARNVYRPCCNNPTSFPDCNHGMAALGIIEWMAYQNASEEEVYTALLAVNSYWFPQTYIETAAYFEYQNVSWENVNPKEILSANYSSATGYSNTRQKLRNFPEIKISGGGCRA